MNVARVLDYTVVPTPIGPVTLIADDQALMSVCCESDPVPRRTHPDFLHESRKNRVLIAASAQLKSYFAGELREFQLPIAAHGTSFQLQVWKELSKIPYGQVVSYGEMAKRIGRPRATRAVASAIRKNPLPIFIPCQRVIGSSGHLTGFGCGLPMKRFLLELEGFEIKTGSTPQTDWIETRPKRSVNVPSGSRPTKSASATPARS